MRDHFKAIYRRLLQNTNYSTHRYLYKSFNTDSRLTGLVGPRGTGKTTLLLQYINDKIEDKSRCIYLSLDNIYFTRVNLIDFVDDFYQIEGIRYIFLDEVHKYQNWDQELKNIYDSYPDINIVFSGSSSMDLIRGTYDLSRRGRLFRLNGMSFREYLEFRLAATISVISFGDLLEKPEALTEQLLHFERIKGLFLEYLENGYYPFVFEDEANYHQKILNVIDKTIYEDISNFYKLKTENLVNFRKILSYLATIPPGQLNRNSISKHIGLDNRTVENYLQILNETGLVCLVKENKAGSSLLKSTEKIYLDNSNIYKAIIDEIGFDYNRGTVREIFFIKMLQNANENVFYSKIGDFQVRDFNFEIGGKSKSNKQIKNSLKDSFLVKDDILFPSGNTIPLYYFGFLY
ncbi:MAG: AAA family ATPase [candidate division KSB1 bacterium]|nr:AAA family ATPase [candidate division KSB1 bacterium]